MYRKIIISCIIIYVLQSFLYPFGKNKVNYQPVDWKVLRTLHFNIFYPKGLEHLALQGARISEEGYIHISNYLHYELTEPIPIVLFPSHADFQNNNIIPNFIGEGTGGFTESVKNRIVIPFTGSNAEFRHVLTHELVHAFQFNMLHDNISGGRTSRLSILKIPLWVMEGMAEYLSLGYDESVDMFMRDAVFNDKFTSIRSLNNLKVPSIHTIYKQGQSFYYFFETKYGKNAIGEIFRDLRDLRSFKKVMENYTGKSIDELNDEWFRFYKRKYYPLISSKKYDDREGERLTNHTVSQSSYNVLPAVSPNGKKIAYITNKDIYFELVVQSLEGDKEVKTIIRGNTGATFEGMLIRKNNISWSGDGTLLTFAAQTNGRDVLYLIKTSDYSIKEKITLPFRSIMDPSISKDGRNIVFSGVGNYSSDIYLYSIKKKNLVRISNNRFSERYPIVINNGKDIIFSTKMTEGSNTEKDDYDIVSVNLETKKKRYLVKTRGNDIHPKISPDSNQILYSSNKSGIYNIYKYDLKNGNTEKITNVLSGVFHPRWFPDSKKIAFVSYQNIGFDIFIKDLSKSDTYPDSDTVDVDHFPVRFPAATLHPGGYMFDDYSGMISPDFLMVGAAAALNYGVIAFAQVALSDYLGNNKLIFSTSYFRDDHENDFNFDLAYYYLRNRWDYGIGAFRQSNPFWLFSIADINDIIHNVYYGTLHMEHYGGYALGQYPFSRYFRTTFKYTMSRYERDFTDDDTRVDVAGNINKISVSFSYDNVLWGRMVPLDGFRGNIIFEQSFCLTGQDLIYSSINADMRKYFLISKRNILAFRLSGGKTFGRDSSYFQYHIGGFNSLRGHGLFEYGGNNMFMVNTEFRFTLIEEIRLGWPLYLGIGQIGGVLFFDVGSAWNGQYVFLDENEGTFGDFKTDFGFGLRFVIYPLLILKLDFAWPYDKKSIGKNDIIFSLGFEY